MGGVGGGFAHRPYGKRGTEGTTREAGGVKGGGRWVPAPVLHEGRLFARTTEGDAVCDKIST